ncbi:hypothetical protein D3C71_1448680 [compost metagenome]
MLAIGAGQRHKRSDIQPGVAQQAFGHVFVHAGGGAENVRADKRQIRHAQHPLQGTIFAQCAMNNREHDVNLGQCLRIARVNQLALLHARYGGDTDVRWIERDMRRIVCVQQVLTGIVHVPLSLLINAQQNDIKTALINRINDIFGRLQ